MNKYNPESKFVTIKRGNHGISIRVNGDWIECSSEDYISWGPARRVLGLEAELYAALVLALSAPSSEIRGGIVLGADKKNFCEPHQLDYSGATCPDCLVENYRRCVAACEDPDIDSVKDLLPARERERLARLDLLSAMEHGGDGK